MPPGSQSDPGGSEPGASAPGTQTQAWGTAPSAWWPSTALQWASHVGRARRRRGLLSTTVTLIGAQGNSAGALGARCFSSPTQARAATSWLRETSSASCPPLTGLSDLGFVCLWMEGFSETHNKQCLLMWLDNKKKRNSVYSQLVTSLNCNAAPRLLKTYLQPSLQKAAVRVKINILTCDL